MKIKIISVFGTRPEAIKMAPVINKLKQNKNFISKVVVTAQHRKMLDDALKMFNIIPDYDMNIMTDAQSIHSVLSTCINKLKNILDKENPHLILVHGDTTTTLASSLAACMSNIKIAHIEAGLRSFDTANPFPEEYNRKITDMLSTYHFVPTNNNKLNLIKENICEDNIFVTGNTVIDALLTTIEKKIKPENFILKNLKDSDRIVFITAHRRENFGSPLENICKGILKLSDAFKDVIFIYPRHPNPFVKSTVKKYLSDKKNILIIEPLSYSDMVWLMKRCRFCFTDSGGIQEEAPSLGKPVLVLRKVTERPEAVNEGTVKVIGTESDTIYHWGKELLLNEKSYKKFSKAVNPYGDGKAAVRIIEILEYIFGLRKEKPSLWKM